MFRNTVLTAMAAAMVFTVAATTADAARIQGGGRVITIWVSVAAHSGEGLWQACRRVYQRDVYNVRNSRKAGLVRCEIDHSMING